MASVKVVGYETAVDVNHEIAYKSNVRGFSGPELFITRPRSILWIFKHIMIVSSVARDPGRHAPKIVLHANFARKQKGIWP
jgi:hypothetical protein